MGVKVSKFRPLFRPELRVAPAHPTADRIFVIPFPKESVTDGGMIVPDDAKKQFNGGIIMAAGDQAADSLYDLGYQIGDEIGFAKYAGSYGQWMHIVADGNDPSCVHDSAWEFVPSDNKAWEKAGRVKDEDCELRSCRTCGALRLTEVVFVMMASDALYNVDAQVRFETGKMKRIRGKTEDGRTRYYIERTDSTDTFEINKETK